MKNLVNFSFLLFLSLSVFAQSIPIISDVKGPVLDLSNKLASSEVETLIDVINYQEMSEHQKITIITLPDLPGNGIANKRDTLLKAWNMPRLQAPNAILILILTNTSESIISYGTETNNQILQEDKNYVYEHVLKSFVAKEEYYEGSMAVINTLFTIVNKKPTAPEVAKANNPMMIFGIIAGILLMGYLLYNAFGKNNEEEILEDEVELPRPPHQDIPDATPPSIAAQIEEKVEQHMVNRRTIRPSRPKKSVDK
jgi:uncharacterized membrane protein YgcG